MYSRQCYPSQIRQPSDAVLSDCGHAPSAARRGVRRRGEGGGGCDSLQLAAAANRDPLRHGFFTILIENIL